MKIHNNYFLNLFIESILFLILINLANFIFEIIIIDDNIIDISFNKGYCAINKKQIGFHVFSNLIVMIVLLFLLDIKKGGKEWCERLSKKVKKNIKLKKNNW